MTLGYRSLAGLLAVFVLGRVEAANLEWSATELRLTGEPGKTSIAAFFPFHNRGEKATRVLSLQPSCDCVAATVAKELYAPDERGEVHIVFTVGGQVGRVERMVTVTTDEPGAKPVVLRLVIDLPEPLRASARLLRWESGKPLEEKTAEIVAGDPVKLSGMEVQCTSPAFATKLERTETPGVYRLRVRPIEAKAGTQGIIRITATLDGRPQVLVVQALVR